MSIIYQDDDLIIKQATQADVQDVFKFVSGCKPLENYAEHVYKIMLRYFGNTCFILEKDGVIGGYLMGMFSQTAADKTFFLWQIGINPTIQGKGLGKKLLTAVEDELRKQSPLRIEVTIDPENSQSQYLFDSMHYNNISAQESDVVTVAGNIAVKDYYSPGRHFMLYEKKLRKAA